MPSDIEIAQKAKMLRVTEVAAKLGIAEDHLEPYGHYKAKVSLKYLRRQVALPIKLEAGQLIDEHFGWCANVQFVVSYRSGLEEYGRGVCGTYILRRDVLH